MSYITAEEATKLRAWHRAALGNMDKLIAHAPDEISDVAQQARGLLLRIRFEPKN